MTNWEKVKQIQLEHADWSLYKIEKYLGWSKGKIYKLQPHIRKRNNRYKKRRFRNFINEQKQLLGCKCMKCGYNKCSSAIDFHHKNPDEKEFSVSQPCYSKERILKEIQKCVLVCSNCHAELHAGLWVLSSNS